MESSKAVLLNVIQAGLDVLLCVTFEDNHRVSSLLGVCFLLYFIFFSFFFSNGEHSVSLMMDAEQLSCAKRQIIGAQYSQALGPADNTVQPAADTAEWTKCRLYCFDCPLDT